MKNKKAHILLVYTGGTIGSFVDPKTGALRPLPFSDIRDYIPEIGQLDIRLTAVSLARPVDSSDANPDVWKELAHIIAGGYADYDGFVVLHGTDTMAYTASALSFMFQGLGKPVILTGSQLPVNVIRTDGRENLVTALEIAAMRENGHPAVQEVCIYFEYKLYRGNRSVKVSAEHFNAFDSPNFPPLGEAGVHIELNRKFLRRSAKKTLSVFDGLSSDLAVLRIFPGMDSRVAEAIFKAPGLRAVVLQTFGTGNAPASASFLDCVSRAVNSGLVVVNVTQCLSGTVDQSLYFTGKGLQNLGVIGSGDMTTEAVITKLMYLLGRYSDAEKVKKRFTENLRGELT
jgi:L-asparaginase